ncbi:aldehyde dehydrogenase family protein [Pirellulaceae bacterium SH449]
MSISQEPRAAQTTPTTAASAKPTLAARFSRAYGAQLLWRDLKLRDRLAILSKLRELLVRDRLMLAQAIQIPNRQSYAETVSAELMPLADSVRWLCRRARYVLRTRYTQRRHTPLWLGWLESSIVRVPHGLVLIIGAGNYPLYLMGVQALQALAAGNAVAIKPAPGAELVTERFVELLIEAGVPRELCVILDSSIESGQAAIEAGVDKVVLTGSSRSGRNVLKQLADCLTPATMELSGCDAMYVLPGADLHRVCDTLVFTLRLNGGASCLAPRRIFLPEKTYEVFHRLLAQRLTLDSQKAWRTQIPKTVFEKLKAGVKEAVQSGARVFESPHANIVLTTTQTDLSNDSCKQASNTFPNATVPNATVPNATVPNVTVPNATVSIGHLVLTDMRPSMSLCSADIFAPLAMIVPVADWAEALQFDSMCPYALTASVYGPVEDALRMTKFISAGSIIINDTLVPTADPQLPFGGRGESGYGVTRGDEGLLGMTVPKVITLRRGRWLPHLQPPSPADESLLDGLLQFNHGGSLLKRLRGLKQTIQAAMASRKKPQK